MVAFLRKQVRLLFSDLYSFRCKKATTSKSKIYEKMGFYSGKIRAGILLVANGCHQQEAVAVFDCIFYVFGSVLAGGPKLHCTLGKCRAEFDRKTVQSRTAWNS